MKTIFNIVGWLLFLGGIAGSLYIGGWLMFIKPIINVTQAFDAGTLTGLLIAKTVLKCIFASFTGWLIFYVSTLLSAIFIN